MLKINIFSSNKLFNDKKFLDMQNKRIEQIKIMNNLYSEHPMKIAEKIDIIDELYRKKTKEENASTKAGNKALNTLENQASINEEASISGDLNSKSGEDNLIFLLTIFSKLLLLVFNCSLLLFVPGLPAFNLAFISCKLFTCFIALVFFILSKAI